VNEMDKKIRGGGLHLAGEGKFPGPVGTDFPLVRSSFVSFVTSQETSCRLLFWDELETEIFRSGVQA
jgi:hypothetical protein